MKKESINKAILKYLKHLTNSEWLIEEAYKFEFANYLKNNIDFETQTDEEILSILQRSQTIKYDRATGVQFIQKSGREKLSNFIQLSDVSLFRQFRDNDFNLIDWRARSMSYTGLSAWLTSLFPAKIFPVPAVGFNFTINYLFETDLNSFPQQDKKYILACQNFLKQTEDELKNYPLEAMHLKVWNKYFSHNPQLNIKPKNHLEQIDWNWLTQDFHLFIYREILNLPKSKIISKADFTITDEFEPITIEGQSKLAVHMRYERNNSFIKKLKQSAMRENPMLNCEVCGFSFLDTYGELGRGFIEAHHKQPLSKTNETKTTIDSIALVCSNCHRMLHKGISQLEGNSILKIDELKVILTHQ